MTDAALRVKTAIEDGVECEPATRRAARTGLCRRATGHARHRRPQALNGSNGGRLARRREGWTPVLRESH